MKTIKYLFTLWLLLLVACLLTETTQGQNIPPANTAGNPIKFTHFSFMDTQGTGIEAFNFLLPENWRFDGGINWILDAPAMPATVAFRVYNTRGKDEFEAFENRCYFWTTSLQLLRMFPPGTKYFGNTVKLPVNALNALKKIILPKERANYPDFKISSGTELPELAKALGGGKAGTTGAKVRFTYVKNGVPMEEEIYAVVEKMTFPVNSMNGVFFSTIWYVDYIFSFKGEKGKLENQTKIFQTITSSFKLNPKWFAKYSNVVEYMAQQKITQIRSIGEFSRMLSQMSDQFRTGQLEQFESRGKVYDKVSEKFSDNTLGIDRYYDPYEERQVELPSGYNHAWCNNNGEYVVSDNPNYNPNVGSNLTWQELKKQ